MDLIDNKIRELGARTLVSKGNVDNENTGDDASLPDPRLPEAMQRMIARCGGPIMFDHGARIKPDEPTPLMDREGYIDIEMLLGIGDRKDCVGHRARQVQDQLPHGYLPIAEAPGGNLICLDDQGAIRFWHHESMAVDDALSLVAISFETFLERLEPDRRDDADTSGVVRSQLPD